MPAIDALMVTDMVTAKPQASVAEVAEQMSRNRIGAVLIVEGGRLQGIFSERDLLNRVVSQHRDPEKTCLWEVATREVVTIDVREPLKKVLEIFREKRFRHLPVVDEGVPVGILSTRDFLEHLVEGFERYIADSSYRKRLDAGEDPYDHLGGSYGS